MVKNRVILKAIFFKGVTMADLTSQLAEAEKQLDSQTGLTDGSVEEDKRNRSETWNFFCFYKR